MSNNGPEFQLFSGVKVLKFKNQEAYVYGETQLIYFSDIREHIKDNQEIELVLQDVDGNTQKIIQQIEQTNFGSKNRERNQTVMSP
jgi:hypothetical protein